MNERRGECKWCVRTHVVYSRNTCSLSVPWKHFKNGNGSRHFSAQMCIGQSISMSIGRRHHREFVLNVTINKNMRCSTVRRHIGSGERTHETLEPCPIDENSIDVIKYFGRPTRRRMRRITGNWQRWWMKMMLSSQADCRYGIEWMKSFTKLWFDISLTDRIVFIDVITLFGAIITDPSIEIAFCQCKKSSSTT